MENCQTRHESPSISNTPLSAIYTWWATPSALFVRRSGLKLEDLPEPPMDMKADCTSRRLDEIRKDGISNDASVWKTQCYFMKLAICSSPWIFLTVVISTTIGLSCEVGGYLLINLLLQAKLEQRDTLSTYAGLLCVVAILKAIIFYCSEFIYERTGNKLKAGYSSLIISKMLSMTEYDLADVSPAHITNLVSTDVDIILAGGYWMFTVIYIVMCTIASIAAYWYLLGWISVIAITVMIAQFTIQLILMTQYTKIRQNISNCSDQRMTITSDVLKGIKAIKMNAWEQTFENAINTIRRLETNIIRKSNLLRSLNSALFGILPRISTFVVLAAYITIYNEFPITQILPFNGLTIIFSQAMGFFLPLFLNTNLDAHVALKRIETFLRRKPIQGHITEELSDNNPRLDLQGISCSWRKESNTLDNITLKAASGLIGIVGKVGSGKSTLLKAILGEIPLKSGKINVQGSVAYVPQEPWVFSATVEQNIIFGQNFNANKLQKALEISALSEDIKTFPNGVKQIVGERGVRLSGGQKSRLNLARAIYADADIYLLDDPLSAVDVNVSKQIYERCITEFMSSKICILITHQVHLLQNTAMNIAISEGKATFHFEVTNNNLIKSDEENLKTAIEAKSIDLSKTLEDTESDEFELQMEQDFHKKGKISFRTYWQYIAKNNIILSYVFILLVLAFNGFICGLLIWLQIWINAEVEAIQMQMSLTNNTTNTNLTFHAGHNFNRNYYFNIFAALTFGTIAVTLCSLAILTQICYQSSYKIHKNLLRNIIQAKMLVFETHPIGKTLIYKFPTWKSTFVNRFSVDLKKIDIDIPQCMIDMVPEFSNSLSYIIITLIANYWLAIPCVILGSLQIFSFQTIFQILREAMRVEGTARSVLYTRFVNALSGLTVIKAFRQETTIRHELEYTLNSCTSARFLKSSFYLWGCQIVQLTTALYIIASVILMVVAKDSDLGEIGICLIASLAFIDSFFWVNWIFGNLQSEIPSLERILHYSNLPTETNPHLLKTIMQKDWPIKGEILFENLTLKYSENGRNILKEINAIIPSNSKIGIVGRTGAGKSSIFDAIYQLHEQSGKIIIDGVDIKDISLHKLRSNLSIIPQEPTLFYGTIRTNIDPLNTYSDSDIWTALEQVEMRDAIKKLEKGLQFQVSEGGSNFSVGERQLLCLARAVLRKNKILMLDEATANVDDKTDRIIQNAIRSHFQNCTVITIAHRLNTVLDSDKIMVFDDGNIIEYDEPRRLLQTPGSALGQLMQLLQSEN